MMALLREKFPNIDAGFGVDLLRLDAVRAGKREAKQKGFATPQSASFRDPSELVDRLVNRFGRDAISVLRPIGRSQSRNAPRCVCRRSKLWPRKALPALRLMCRLGLLRKASLRPAFLLARPEPIDVTAGVPADPPKSFIWRRVERRVVSVEGPERIAPEWWTTLYLEKDQKQPRARDYYKIEDQQGAMYWVFRHGLYEGEAASEAGPTWFLHGLFA